MRLDRVLERSFGACSTSYSRRDTMLYALGVAACQDPLDRTALRYVYEDGLEALPSIACVLAHPGFWFKEPELDIDWPRILHVGQSLHVHRPLAPEDEIVGRYRVLGILDKGPDKGALLRFEKTLHAIAGDPIATVESLLLLRGDGGCGSWGTPSPMQTPCPDGPSDGHRDVATSACVALIYRLSGDYNPVHADPAVARTAGFERPILQGLCTYGVACHSLVTGLCSGDATRLRVMEANFTKPTFPGETIRTEWWRTADGARFRSISLERDVVVLDRGKAVLTG